MRGKMQGKSTKENVREAMHAPDRGSVLIPDPTLDDQ
jgi:hypothetical protein